MSYKKTSVFLSLLLRHKPDAAEITLDEHGWAQVDELINNVNRLYPGKYQLSLETLEKIVAEDEKQRYSFSDDKKLIRANQGHSIPVDVELKEKMPSELLYHGTAEKYTDSIEKNGLIKKSRLYVHLSRDIETAKKVGARHGKPVIYIVRSGDMYNDGYKFFLSENNVWLTDRVPVFYLERTDIS